MGRAERENRGAVGFDSDRGTRGATRSSARTVGTVRVVVAVVVIVAPTRMTQTHKKI